MPNTVIDLRVQDHARVHVGDNNYYQTEDRCLADLRTTDPRLDKKRTEQTRGGLLPDAYRWILDNPDFQRWRDDLQSQLLWIKGDPGKGKTMLLCGIIDNLSSTTKLTDPNATTLLSYFFCQATDLRINSAAAVLRGLIYLLVQQQPSLVAHIRKKYDDAGKELFQDVNAWVALSEMLADILHDPGLKAAYLVVDALDECETGLPQLLDFIVSHSTASPRVKWIVSSRNWPDIEERLEPAEQKVRLRLELNADSVSAAVEIYIQERVRQLAERKKYDNKTRDAVTAHLSSNANDTFLWVALVCQNLEKLSYRKTLAMLHVFPAGLDSLYRRMMEQICRMEDADDVNLCKRILAIVSTVYQPITLDELASFIDLPHDISDRVRWLEEIIGLCGSFLAIRQQTVYFVHQSAKDFLTKKALDTVFPLGFEDVHYTLFSRSLQVMSRTVQRDIYGLRHPGFPIDEVKPRDPDPLAAARYSCIYWAGHLGDSDVTTKCTSHNAVLWDSGIIYNFLAKKYLYWLEALSLLGSISEGVLSISGLEGLIGSTESSLVDLVRDARRFILSFGWAIRNAPLQAYGSALVFSPARSLIRKLFEAEEPGWIMAKPAVEADWSACLATLEGHVDWVNSVAFSHDGTRVASGSTDETIKIWDLATGDCVRTLEGHGGCVNSVAFSHDGTRVASGSDDDTIKIWDLATGDCVRTLEGHGGTANSVAFSHDGTQVTSGSGDRTIKIWDLAKGDCVRTLEGHGGFVYSVSFSHDGTRVASGSDDDTIKIWDLATGDCVRTLEGHGGSVWSVAFSHNGTQVVSGSNDRTIKIWDLATGDCVRTLEGHGGFVWSVSFSHDGTRVASGSTDETIKIWDLATGDCVRTLEGHGSWVNSVAFSHDGTRVVSGSTDKTIKTWDLAKGDCVRTLEGHDGFVNRVAFSHDSTQVASGSDDRTIKIWDLAKGDCVRTLEGHDGFVNQVAFSHDGTRVASGSSDSTIKIWDLAKGECVRTLKGLSSSVESVVFSHDGTRVASGSNDRTIKIWDLATGDCVRTLEGHGGLVNSAAFSHDGTRVASGSRDRAIKIWDLAKGECVRTLKGHGGWVNSVAFSHDGTRVASGSDDRTIKIWDLATGDCVCTLQVGQPLFSLSFDSTGSHFHTEAGAFDLCLPSSTTTVATAQQTRLPASTPRPHRQGYGISADGIWITYHGENLLWLPAEYRPWRPAVAAVMASSIAIGCASGRVLLFRFSDDIPVSLRDSPF